MVQRAGRKGGGGWLERVRACRDPRQEVGARCKGRAVGRGRRDGRLRRCTRPAIVLRTVVRTDCPNGLSGRWRVAVHPADLLGDQAVAVIGARGRISVRAEAKRGVGRALWRKDARSRKAMDGHGRPWKAMEGHGRIWKEGYGRKDARPRKRAVGAWRSLGLWNVGTGGGHVRPRGGGGSLRTGGCWRRGTRTCSQLSTTCRRWLGSWDCRSRPLAVGRCKGRAATGAAMGLREAGLRLEGGVAVARRVAACEAAEVQRKGRCCRRRKSQSRCCSSCPAALDAELHQPSKGS